MFTFILVNVSSTRRMAMYNIDFFLIKKVLFIFQKNATPSQKNIFNLSLAILIQLVNFLKFFTFISVRVKLTRRMTVYKIDLFLILSQKSCIHFFFFKKVILSKKIIINLSLKNFDSTCWFFKVFHIYLGKYEVDEKHGCIRNWSAFNI